MRHVKALDRLLKKAQADSEVLAVILFGSAARGEETPNSDMDVCLVLTPSQREPAALAEMRLDYLAAADLDVHIFQTLPLYIRRRVLKEGRVEYARDEDLLYEVAYRSAQAYEDFKHLHHEYLDQIAHG